jgi:hypothetical protein
MNKIQKLLQEHNEEFLEMVDNFYDEKYPSKKEKTICYFKVAGKHYRNDIFNKNYKSFLNDLSTSMGAKAFKRVMGRYVEFNQEDFSPSIIRKGQYENINGMFYISTYSSTETKIKHIQDLCEFLDIPLVLEYPKTNYTDIARELGIIQ